MNKIMPGLITSLCYLDTLRFLYLFQYLLLENLLKEVCKRLKTPLEDFSIHMEETKKTFEEDYKVVMQQSEE